MRRDVWGPRLKGIRRQKRGERVVKYHRATGIRLPDLPETHPAFVDAWARAEARAAEPLAKVSRAKPVRAGTVADAVRSFRIGAAFKGLSAPYQATLRRHMEVMAADYGDAMLTAIQAAHIEADLDKLPANPANDRLKAWRRLMEHRKITPDPSRQVRRRKIETDGHEAWSAAEIAAFRARWPVGTTARAAFELVFWTGARTCDAVRLGRGNIGADGLLTFKQTKTGGSAYVPWANALPSFAVGWEAERAGVMAALDRLAGGFTFLETNGRVRSVKGLGNLINDAARDAGLKDRTAHGLRKARLTMIAEAGGTAHAIMAWGGHKSLAEVEHYTRAAQMRRLVTGERDVNDVSPPVSMILSRMEALK